MNNEEKILDLLEKMNDRLSKLEEGQKELKEDNQLIRTQQQEHGQILSALKTASEFQKAETDRMKIDIAHISGDIKALSEKIDTVNKKVDDVIITNKALSDAYGEHDIEIRKIRKNII